MIQLVLDAGALIALERGDRQARAFVFLAEQGRTVLSTSSAVIAQVWRGGARHARLARFLTSDLVNEHALDEDASRRIGALAAVTGATDVVDGHVALLALERRAKVLTSDIAEIARWGVEKHDLIRI